MGLKRPQHPAYGPVSLAPPFKRCRDIAFRLHDHRDDDVAEALARRLPHDAPDGLDHIHLAVPRIEKCHGIQRRHIHALGEELNVADQSAFALPVRLRQRAQFPVTLQRASRRIKVPGHHLHRPPGLHAPGGRSQDLAFHQRFRVPLRARDAVRKRHGARELARLLQGSALGHAVHRQRHAQHPRHVVGGGGLFALGRWGESFKPPPQAWRDAAFAHAENDDPVVGQHPVFHGLGERKPVEFRPVNAVVAHIGHVDVVLGQFPLGSLGIDPRRGGHIQPFSRMQPCFVVELLKIHFSGDLRSTFVNQRAGCAVRLVGDGQVEWRRAMARLGFRDPSQ